MWFIGVEVEQETSAPPPKKNPGPAPVMVPWVTPHITFIGTGDMLNNCACVAMKSFYNPIQGYS